jgi:hypothetical protein
MDAALAARMNLGFGSILSGQLGGAYQLVQEEASRRMQELEQTGSALLLRQQGEQLVEQARTEILLRQQQEQLAKLEDFRKGQQWDMVAQLRGSSATGDALPGTSAASQLEMASSQYQNLLAQIRESSSRSNALGQQQSLLAAQLGGSSSVGGPLLNATSAAGPLGSVLGVPSTARNPVGGSFDASMGTIERSDPAAYLTMLMTQQKLQAQMNALGQTLSPEEMRSQQALFLQGQQQQLNEFFFQRALESTAAQVAGNATEQQGDGDKKQTSAS